MDAGKAASQASHAAVQTALECLKKDPERFREYQGGEFGTKVCLEASNEEQLRELLALAQQRGICCALIEDSGHTEFYDGRPTVTALGIGPVRRAEFKELKKLKLLKGASPMVTAQLIRGLNN